MTDELVGGAHGDSKSRAEPRPDSRAAALAERPLAVAICGTDPGRIATSWRTATARREWLSLSARDLPIAIVTGFDQRAEVGALCPGAVIVGTGGAGWPGAAAVARAWADEVDGSGSSARTVVVVRSGRLPALDAAFRAAAGRVDRLTAGSTSEPGPVDLLVVPPELRVPVDPRVRGALSPRDSDAVLAAAGFDPEPHPDLRYDRPAIAGPAFLASDLAAETRNAVVLDPEVSVDDDLIEIGERSRRERESPFWAYDAIVVVNRDADAARWRDMSRRAAALGFGERLERFPAVDNPGYPNAGAVVSHRQVVEDARRRGLQHVLLLGDDVVFRRGTRAILSAANASLGLTGSRDAADGEAAIRGEEPAWDVAYLGIDSADLAGRVDGILSAIPGRPALRRIDRQIWAPPAQLIRSSAFEKLLDELPRTIAEAEAWCERRTATDRRTSDDCLAGRPDAVTVWPQVAARVDQLTTTGPGLPEDERVEFTI